MGYTLHRSVRHAISEGIVPVVLTGRFLRNLADGGFLWLPGVKYKIGSQLGDIDLLACCDGRLVFCECKQLDNVLAEAPVWDDIITQFQETVSVAKRCKGSLVVLASQVTEYPDAVKKRIAEMIDGSIPHLLLNRHDLEEGCRKVIEDNFTRRMRLHDILPICFSERPREPKAKSREINLGWGIYSLGNVIPT